MWKRKGVVVQCFLVLLTTFWVSVHAEGDSVVKKGGERRAVFSNQYGEISAVRVSDRINGTYLLHFFSLEPNSLLLPLVLNADMIFYVHQGSGRVSWTEENEVRHMYVRRGDAYRLVQGSVFYIISDEEQQTLKLHAIFPNSNDDLREPTTEPYSSVQHTVLAFDKTVLQATFKVREEVIDELLGGTKPPAITRVDNLSVRYLEKTKGKERKRAQLFNLLEAQKKIENRYGWSTVVTRRQLPSLEDSRIALFMLNLTAGSMMEPHWNTIDAEVAVVVEGRGMVRVLSPSITKGTTRRFEAEQGDVLVVPRFHPAVQMAFNNASFALMGFSRIMKKSSAQLIAGKSSMLHVLSRDVLELSFNVRRTTLDELLLASREDSVISSCLSCAEKEMQIIKEGTGSHPAVEEEAEGHRGGGEEEARSQQGGDEQLERQEAEGHRGGDEWQHGGGEEEAERQQEGGDEQRQRQEAEEGHRGGGEEEVGRQHEGGEEQRGREKPEGHREGDEWPHGGGEEAGRRDGGDDEQLEREEAEGHRGGDEWRQREGDNEAGTGRQHKGEQEMEGQSQNHYYVQGVRRILKTK